MSIRLRTLCILAMVAFSGAASGCIGPNRTSIDASGAFSSCATSQCAVLSVSARKNGGFLCAPLIWGWYEADTPGRRFANILSSTAAQAGLPVMHSWDAHNSLEDAGYEATLEPDQQEVLEFARAIGCETYLEVRIHKWGYCHFLTTRRAALDFTIICRAADDGDELWRVSASAKRNGMTDLEIAPLVVSRVVNLVARKGNVKPYAEVPR